MTTILLTETDGGRSIAARAGDEIVLQLPENPTTGYRWEVVIADGLEPVADGYVAAQPAPADAEPAFGRGSLRELRFRVREPGVARLEAKHWQAWEGEDSVDARFAADIVASEGTAGG
jgi:inhibitor of cysteine peptidase